MGMANMKYGELRERIGPQMTRIQALKLKSLAEEAYQPRQYAEDLSFDEATLRIEALKAEIALANSF
jgi:hypothetical protein